MHKYARIFMKYLAKDDIDELAGLKESGGGVLTAEAILERARSENSALHALFDWDDTAAAHAWRLRQAQGIIRAVVKVWSRPAPEPVHVIATRAGTASLATTLASVMGADARLRCEVSKFKREVLALEAKYGSNPTIAPVLAEMLELVSGMAEPTVTRVAGPRDPSSPLKSLAGYSTQTIAKARALHARGFDAGRIAQEMGMTKRAIEGMEKAGAFR
jgi:hypothetical protein